MPPLDLFLGSSTPGCCVFGRVALLGLPPWPWFLCSGQVTDSCLGVSFASVGHAPSLCLLPGGRVWGLGILSTCSTPHHLYLCRRRARMTHLVHLFHATPLVPLQAEGEDEYLKRLQKSARDILGQRGEDDDRCDRMLGCSRLGGAPH